MKKFIVAAVSFLALQAHAGVVVNNSISGSVTNTFDNLAVGNVSGLITQTGATYGERFTGQTVSASNGFDVVSGQPTALTLRANANKSDNIGIVPFGTNIIYGDLSNAIGEGALSILLGSGSDVFGFDVIGSSGGQFSASFYNANGGLIGSINQTAQDTFFGFNTTGGDLIYGVTLTNTDPLGIGYDNVKFNQNAAQVPEPASLALLSLGMLGVAGACRRKS